MTNTVLESCCQCYTLNSSEKELFRQELERDIPEVPSGGKYWRNYLTVPIKEDIKGSFFIYVIDILGRDMPVGKRYYVEAKHLGHLEICNEKKIAPH